ncbi:MAG: hypothetical protein C5S45_02460 [Candidatus Methanocomedens sp.]|nr:MAG: hypothetical protein C5S45_02460 [ANME-2 cluster archaeon]
MIYKVFDEWGLGTKLLNLQSHNFAVFFSKLNYKDIILGRKSL